ncbi:hypothetical protein [Pseudooceanicola aestuarii]|uniref:hypothetical protein n=1 Tax=Pseudooceanicola aestuarii TaxID=2697319 RepID=UPI0013D0AE89|nr:hypothetical protein [Pseudooceanicola aestuarii]
MKLAFASVTATLIAATSALALTPADPAQSQRDLELYGPTHSIVGEEITVPAEAVENPSDVTVLGFDDRQQYLFGFDTAEAPTAREVK